MRLVELLARKFDTWPEGDNGCDSITQDASGKLNSTDEGERPEYDDHKEYWSGMHSTLLSDPDNEDEILSAELATDHATAIVTREMWEAEVARQTAEKINSLDCSTESASIEPDWDSAPEGYDYWVSDNRGIIPAMFHKVDGKDYYDQSGGHWPMDADDITVLTRPTKPQWSGEGLPPVGVECEYVRNDVKYRQGYVKVTPLYFGKELVLLRHSAGGNEYTESVSSCVFRPIDTRTPREKWIDRVRYIVADYVTDYELGRIFDNGLAKLPEDGE